MINITIEQEDRRDIKVEMDPEDDNGLFLWLGEEVEWVPYDELMKALEALKKLNK